MDVRKEYWPQSEQLQDIFIICVKHLTATLYSSQCSSVTLRYWISVPYIIYHFCINYRPWIISVINYLMWWSFCSFVKNKRIKADQIIISVNSFLFYKISTYANDTYKFETFTQLGFIFKIKPLVTNIIPHIHLDQLPHIHLDHTLHTLVHTSYHTTQTLQDHYPHTLESFL